MDADQDLCSDSRNDDALLDQFRAAEFTIANHDGNFTEWHKGQEYYLFWMIPVNSSPWHQAVASARRHLGRYLLDGYERQPHVTVLPAGFPYPNCINSSRVEDIVREIEPFDMSAGPLSSFTSSPCYEIRRGDAPLKVLRRALRNVLWDPDSQVDDSHYVPHLTVGLYDSEYLTGGVAEAIKSFRDPRPGLFHADRLVIGCYRANSVKGTIKTVASFDFGSGKKQILSHPDWIN